MRLMMVTSAALVVFGSTLAFADEKPSADEAAKIKEAVAAWGCEGGEYEKEAEATGVFEVDDAKCKDGQYDFRLDKDFNVTAVTRD